MLAHRIGKCGSQMREVKEETVCYLFLALSCPLRQTQVSRQMQGETKVSGVCETFTWPLTVNDLQLRL